jgi:hypothetical protein
MQEKSKNSSDKKEKILTLIKKHKYRMQIHIIHIYKIPE